MLWIVLLLAIIYSNYSVSSSPLKTTRPVSVVLDGFTIDQWNDQILWNQTRTFIVSHLNAFCRKDSNCDAEYGNNNIHLHHIEQCGFSSIRLNITADEPINDDKITIYNYTALLTGALFQAKIDIEHFHDNQEIKISSLTSTPFYENSTLHQTSRLLFLLIGISLVSLIITFTILFFRRIRQHRYTKLLKATAQVPITQDD